MPVFKTLITLLCLTNTNSEMIESKIFVVIIVLSTVLVGLALYLFWLDRRVTKMENEIKNNKN
jgi:CcmD family protein